MLCSAALTRKQITRSLMVWIDFFYWLFVNVKGGLM